eukprot:gnl/MRDRNA2_/MRDRNA2_201272_c0_seq1.p1 gnl/MRDRNA2_/MRDRNA2_201272_c0~~gnl/MRDRNA2_/MRDRNA2_201272_c0_seq1.p1  ORF type:complete len:253 (-),score=53.46 gnl/MRDRNA2_/MRDRNA2_201272_c0_seq1:306-1064(-)
MGNFAAGCLDHGILCLPNHDGPPQIQGKDFWKKIRECHLWDVVSDYGGIVQVLDLLPDVKALNYLQILENLPKHEWSVSETKLPDDATHKFGSYDGFKILEVRSMIESMAPDMAALISSAKYEKGHHIEPHDDSREHDVVDFDEYCKRKGVHFPPGKKYRKLAIIYYMTQDWCEEYGGCLVDLGEEEPKVIVPQFNSLITFTVPREHEVTEMLEGSPPRYTFFGWFSDDEPYPLAEEDDGEESEEEDDSEAE